MQKPIFIKIKQIDGKEKWINPWNIATITNDLSRVVLRMTNNEVAEIDYNEKENKPLLDYMQLWAPPEKKVI